MPAINKDKHLPGLVALCGLLLHPIWRRVFIICGTVRKTTFVVKIHKQKATSPFSDALLTNQLLPTTRGFQILKYP